MDLRHELPPEQRKVEPTNADSHLAFIGSGLHACVVRRAGRPVYLVDLDGTTRARARRETTLVGYDSEVDVTRTLLRVPVSMHPIDAVNLKDPQLGLYEQLSEAIQRHGVTKAACASSSDPASSSRA